MGEAQATGFVRRAHPRIETECHGYLLEAHPSAEPYCYYTHCIYSHDAHHTRLRYLPPLAQTTYEPSPRR